MDARPHIPVMLEAVLQWLDVRPGGIYVDCTAGAGGHAAAVAERMGDGRLIALDRDPSAVALARERLDPFPGAAVVNANYAELAAVLREAEVAAVDGVLIDAGVSSMQLDQAERGFSFQADGPLDMRMDPAQEVDARTFLMRCTAKELAGLLRDYGDVGPAKRIAAAICARRNAGRLEDTGDLAAAVREALDFVQGEPSELRTVFQAVRMAVNEELKWLEAGLRAGMDALRPGGRLVAIAFHSGEDRVVKRVLREASRRRRELHPDGRVRRTIPAALRLLTPKPVMPDAEEVVRNPRAKSARLRAAEKLEET